MIGVLPLLLIGLGRPGLIFIAILLAVAGSIEFGRRWLESFVYKDSLDPIVFILAAMVTIILTVITVSTHALKASNVNPANVLKDE